MALTVGWCCSKDGFQRTDPNETEPETVGRSRPCRSNRSARVHQGRSRSRCGVDVHAPRLGGHGCGSATEHLSRVRVPPGRRQNLDFHGGSGDRHARVAGGHRSRRRTGTAGDRPKQELSLRGAKGQSGNLQLPTVSINGPADCLSSGAHRYKASRSTWRPTEQGGLCSPPTIIRARRRCTQ